MTSQERKELRAEVKMVQSIQRATGENVTGIHETERAIAEQRRVQEALEQAQPSFLRDGNGLRGPQLPVATQIDGVDGWGNSIQVKRRGKGADDIVNIPTANLRVKALIVDEDDAISVATVALVGSVIGE